MVKGSEPGKWFVGAGFLILGLMQIIAGLSLGFEVNSVLFILVLPGVYLIYVVIEDQLSRNLKLPRFKF